VRLSRKSFEEEDDAVEEGGFVAWFVAEERWEWEGILWDRDLWGVFDDDEEDDGKDDGEVTWEEGRSSLM
jgi:hypothetical protein